MRSSLSPLRLHPAPHRWSAVFPAGLLAPLALLASAALGCGSSEDTTNTAGATTATTSTTGAGGAGGGGEGGAGGAGGGAATDPLSVLHGYLLGDFDNQAQNDAGFDKLVERHVCNIPGRDGDPAVLWLYVEHVEVLPDGTRDAYFTRVNEIAIVNDNPVSRAYKFDTGHPLYTDAFSFNGSRDGCTQPDVLQAILDTDLVYRDGCDVTFVQNGAQFDASTTEGTCSFPGGYIQTTAVVTADGLDVQDAAVSGGQTVGDKFEFRRVTDFMPPGG